MSELKDRLRSDLTAAMKARDDVRTRALRMALTAVTTEEVSGDAGRELADDEVTGILTREVKRRKEAAAAFDEGDRAQKAADERAEAEVLADYLPEQLTNAELSDLVSAAIAETGATGVAAMGTVMKTVTPRVAGRAEGARVAAEVRAQLGA